MKKIGQFTRDAGNPLSQLAEKLAAEPGVIWELAAGEDYPEGEEVKTVQRLSTWARKRGMKARTSIPPSRGTVEVRFSAREPGA